MANEETRQSDERFERQVTDQNTIIECNSSQDCPRGSGQTCVDGQCVDTVTSSFISNEKPDDSVEELKKELNYIDEIENHKNEPIKIKKRSHIEDDEESDYSNNGDKEEDEDDEKEEDEEDEEDDEDDEEYKDEKKNVETRGKESSLF